MVNPLDPVAAGERNAVGTCGIPESSTEVRTSSISPIRTRHVAVLFLLQLGLGLIFLKTVPRFFNDEAWEASIGHSLAYEGRLRHGIIEGWGGMHVHFLQNQIVHPFVLAPIYRVGGFGVVTSRIASVLMGGVAVVCIYGALRFWFTTRFAFLVGLITIFHPWYFEASRRIRPDIYALALAFAAWWLCVSALRHRSPWRAFAAGILGGLAGLAHPTGLVLAATLVIGTLCWDRPRRWGHQLGCGVFIDPAALRGLRPPGSPTSGS